MGAVGGTIPSSRPSPPGEGETVPASWRWQTLDSRGEVSERSAEVGMGAGSEVFAFRVSEFCFYQAHHPDDFFRVGEKALFSGRIKIQGVLKFGKE